GAGLMIHESDLPRQRPGWTLFGVNEANHSA
ncbi:uncharacterized protein METZ01_LOCUS358710, partial [marine metagenome]